MMKDKLFINYCNSVLFAFRTILITAVVCFGMLLLGNYYNFYTLSLAAVAIFWVYGMLYGLVNVYNQYAYAIMQFMLFVFLLSRPVLAQIYNLEWNYWNEYSIETTLMSIYLCELSMMAGSYLFGCPSSGKSCALDVEKTKICGLQMLLLLMVFMTGLVEVYVTIRNYSEYRYLDYEALYTSSTVYYPAIIRGLSTVFPFAVFGYLATMPKKRHAVVILLLYIGLGIPTFILGNRTSLVLRIAFATIYYFIRDYSREKGEPRWITGKIKMFFITFTLLAIAFLGAYNYTRVGKQASDQTYIPIMADFFYRQGTSFDTICQGLFYEPIIRAFPSSSYTLGGILDSLTHSTLSQMLFGTSSLGNGNSVNMVVNGNSMAHRLSYVVFGERYYLQGHGRGSSFILETYYDGGYAFVCLYSFMLGVFLSNINRLIQKKNWIINIIVITCMSGICMIPRASACTFFQFLFTPHFWLFIAFVMIGTRIANTDKPWIIVRKGVRSDLNQGR